MVNRLVEVVFTQIKRAYIDQTKTLPSILEAIAAE